MRILLIADTHLSALRPSAGAHFAAARAYAARIRPDLTIHLGDITRDAWSAPEELDHAAALGRDWPSPLRYIPGNHDIGDNPPGEGVETKQALSQTLLASYRALFGDDRWALDVAGADGDPSWRLIGLNAQLFGTGGHAEKVQWDWLADAVHDAAGLKLAVFSHKPLFQADPLSDPPHIRYVPAAARRALMTLLAQADWRLWVSGHTHQAWDRTIGGVRHIWAPSLAYRFPDAMQETLGVKIVGAQMLTLGDDGTTLDLAIPDGVAQVTYDPRA